MPPGRVVVVGGGISGLTAAWQLTGGAEPTRGGPQVVVLEASGRFGGALRSDEFGGRAVDMGPDGFLGRRIEAVDLAREVGLADALVPIGGRGASVWARGRLRRLPDGLALGVPTRVWPVTRSGILGTRGRLGLVRDKLAPRPDVRGPLGDRSIGPLVSRKLGRAVTETLVDPLIGGIHAGSVDDMSAAAVFPPLLAAAGRRGSLMRSLRKEMPAPDPDGPPLFWSVAGGMAALVGALTVGLGKRNVALHLDRRADALDRGERGWAVRCGDRSFDADAVVLAVPAPASADLLRPHDDEAASLLDGIDYASVTLVTFRVVADDVPDTLFGTGFLVPRHGGHRGRDEPWAVTACTYLDRKWPHLGREGEVLLRASLGRSGDTRADDWSDEDTAARAWDELGALLGVTGSPVEAVVVRHRNAFPQYRVHHLLRTAGVEAAVARLGGIAVAGAAYHGVGIPACVASGRSAARSLL